MCKSKLLSKLFYIHLLPRLLYKWVLIAFKEDPNVIEKLIEIYDTRINIERFERILRRNDYQTNKRVFYFINPNYDVKFGWKPRKSSRLIAAIPWLRNFFITTNYYIVSLREDVKT